MTWLHSIFDSMFGCDRHDREASESLRAALEDNEKAHTKLAHDVKNLQLVVRLEARRAVTHERPNHRGR